MSEKNLKTWPDYYTSWEGDLSSLVETANKIVSDLGYEGDITERSVRNYQHKTLVGRGLRQGKSSVFSFADLAGLVAAKTLVKEGWTIAQTASYLSGGVQNSLTSTADVSSFHAHSSPASQVVADLMSNTLESKMPIYQGQSLSNSFSARAQPQALSLPTQSHYLLPGFVLSVDQATWNSLSPQKQKEVSDYISTIPSSLNNIFKG